MKIFTSKVAGLTFSLLIGFNALGIDIYDSYPTYNGTSFSVQNGQQIGNEITLSSANVIMTGFNFEYYTSPTLASTAGVELRFYTGNPSTGSLFYDSGIFSPITAAPGAGPPASPTGGADVIYGAADFGAGILLPTDFTFTLTFTGLASTNTLNILLANPPSGQIGSTTSNYWFSTGSGFTLLSASGAPSGDIGVQLTGSLKTPDASATAGLLGLGSMAMFVWRHKFVSNLKKLKKG
jgi:hypothetical protein